MDQEGVFNILMAVGGLVALFWAFRHRNLESCEQIGSAPLDNGDVLTRAGRTSTVGRMIAIAVVVLVFVSLVASIALTVVVANNAASGTQSVKTQDSF